MQGGRSGIVFNPAYLREFQPGVDRNAAH